MAYAEMIALAFVFAADELDKEISPEEAEGGLWAGHAGDLARGLGAIVRDAFGNRGTAE